MIPHHMCIISQWNRSSTHVPKQPLAVTRTTSPKSPLPIVIIPNIISPKLPQGRMLLCIWCPAYLWAYKILCPSLVSFTPKHSNAEQAKACMSAVMRDALLQLNPQGTRSPFVFTCNKPKWGHTITPSVILPRISSITLFMKWDKSLPRTETHGSSSPSLNTGCI